MRLSLIILNIFLILACIVAEGLASNSFCDQDGWNMIWQDEFDAIFLNASTWTVDTGSNNSKVRNSTGTLENVYLEDGNLVLRTQKERRGDYFYTSGAVASKGKKSWAGSSRVCISATLPGGGSSHKGDGIWPAHWLMPDSDACWPTNGEIDIMEMINSDGVLHGTYHWSEECNKNDFNAGTTNMSAEDFGSQYHEYAVEYNSDRISWALDGEIYHTVTKAAFILSL